MSILNVTWNFPPIRSSPSLSTNWPGFVHNSQDKLCNFSTFSNNASHNPSDEFFLENVILATVSFAAHFFTHLFHHECLLFLFLSSSHSIIFPQKSSVTDLGWRTEENHSQRQSQQFLSDDVFEEAVSNPSSDRETKSTIFIYPLYSQQTNIKLSTFFNVASSRKFFVWHFFFLLSFLSIFFCEVKNSVELKLHGRNLFIFLNFISYKFGIICWFFLLIIPHFSLLASILGMARRTQKYYTQ